MHSQTNLIELLDRKHNLVAEIENPSEFLLELGKFLEFIQSDRQLRFYIEQMINAYKRLIIERDHTFGEQERKAIDLRRNLAEICPALDDSEAEPATGKASPSLWGRPPHNVQSGSCSGVRPFRLSLLRPLR